MKPIYPKPVNFETLKTCFGIFFFLNLLTIPLSPVMGGGLMSKEAYTPIMYVKLSLIGLFIAWGAVLLVMHIVFLRKKKQMLKHSLSLVKLADELDAKGLYKEADGITNILSKFLINQNETRK